MTLLDNYELFSTLDRLIEEKMQLIYQQLPRLQKIWENIWGSKDLALPAFTLLQYESSQFFSDSHYRTEFLKNFQNQLNEFYFFAKDIIELIFNKYLNSIQFRSKIPDSFIIPMIIKSAEFCFSSITELLSIGIPNIPLIYIMIGHFSSFLNIRSQSIQQIHNGIEKYYEDLELNITISAIKQLVELKYYVIIDENGGKSQINKENIPDLMTNIKKNPKFFESSCNVLFDKTLKPIFEWIIGFWQSYYNFRRLNQTVPNDLPAYHFLQEKVKWAATQGLEASWNLLQGFIDYFNQNELMNK